MAVAGHSGHGMSVGRLEAFSDGVLAIVITLLILDIKVPTGEHGHLGRANQPRPAVCDRRHP